MKEKFQKATGILLTNYRGLTVEEIAGLRRSLKEISVEYKVVKNTLAKIAAEGTGVEVLKDKFVGPIGVAFGYDDPVILAKKMIDFSAKNEKFKVSCGIVEGKFVDFEKIKKLSKLPSREVQLAMLASAISSPVSKMASLLRQTIQRLGYALNALADKKKEKS